MTSIIDNEDIYADSEGTLYTTSLAVVRVFEKEHKNVMQAIVNLTNRQNYDDVEYVEINLGPTKRPSMVVGLGESIYQPTSETSVTTELEEFDKENFILTTYKDAQNKKRPMYKLTEEGFMLLVMGFEGKKAKGLKIAFIKAFKELKKNYQSRRLLASGYKDMSAQVKSLKESQGKEPMFYHYSNEADMINRLVFGKTSAKMVEELGENFRDKLSLEQKYLLHQFQVMNKNLIELGFEFDDRKTRLTNLLPSKVNYLKKLEQTKKDKLLKDYE